MNIEDTAAGFFITGLYALDNFAPFQVEWRGKLYPTSEHAYQAAIFIETNGQIAEEIRLAGSPVDAFTIARSHGEDVMKKWYERHAIYYMDEVIHAKYEQHEFVRKTLKDTANREIIEMNDNDSIWGWGPDHKGRNELGKIWMRLREETQ